MPRKSKTAKPKWKLDVAIRAGREAHTLGVAHRIDLEPRLEAGALDHLDADVVELEAEQSGVAVAQADKTSATAHKGDSAEEGFSVSSSMRDAIRRNHLGDEEILKAFGLKAKVVKEKPSTIVSSLQTLLSGAQAHPEALRAAGVLPSDLDAAKSAVAALTAAGTTQATKKLTAKQATAQRAETQRRVESAVSKLIGAAGLAFRGQPAKLQPFEALVPKK